MVSLILCAAVVRGQGPSLHMLSPGQTFATGDRNITFTIGEGAYEQWTPVIGAHTLQYDWAGWWGWGDIFGSLAASCYSPRSSPTHPSSIHTHNARLRVAYGNSINARLVTGGIGHPMQPLWGALPGPFNVASLYSEASLELEVDRNAWLNYRSVVYRSYPGWDYLPVVYANAHVRGYTSNADPAADDYYLFQVGLQGPPGVSPVHRLVIQRDNYQSLHNRSLGGLELDGTTACSVTLNGSPVAFDGGQTSIVVQEGDLVGVRIRAESSLHHNGPIQPDLQYSAGVPQYISLGSVLTTSQVRLWYATGVSEEYPLMPDGPKMPGESFTFEGLTIGSDGLGIGGAPIWFDPPLIEGYEFNVSGNTVTEIRFPMLSKDADGIVIRYFDGTDWHSERVWENEWMSVYAFSVPVSWFVIEDIQLVFEEWQNPDNFMMAMGLMFADEALTDVTITPIAGTDVIVCSDADINNDNVVDLNDAAILAAGWNQSGAGLVADINRDGIVDIRDLYAVALHWLSVCGGE